MPPAPPLPPTSCSLDQIIRWDGSAWICGDEGGVSGVEQVSSGYLREAPGVYSEVCTATCPEGKSTLGGGYSILLDTGSGFGARWEWDHTRVPVFASEPTADGWAMTFYYEIGSGTD